MFVRVATRFPILHAETGRAPAGPVDEWAISDLAEDGLCVADNASPRSLCASRLPGIHGRHESSVGSVADQINEM